jgi:hypothetical protein
MNNPTTFETIAAILCGAVAFCVLVYLLFKGWQNMHRNMDDYRRKEDQCYSDKFISKKPKN